MSTIKKLYETKKKNANEIISWLTLKNLFDLIKETTHYQCNQIAKNLNDNLNKQIIKLKEIIKKLKKVIDETDSKFKNNI